MSFMIKLCAFDLDGTLLAPGGILTDRTADALRCLSEKGIVPALISGRSPCYVGAFLLRAGVKGYVSGSNGSYIISPKDEVIYRNAFPPDLTAAITKILAERESIFAVQTRDAIIGNTDLKMALRDRFTSYCSMAAELGLNIIFPYCDLDIIGAPMDDVLKIAVTSDPVGIPECLSKLSEMFSDITTSLSGPTVGDINLIGDNKGTALKRIADDLGVLRDEICCFGDYNNDLSMFHEAGLSIAMGNSTPAVLAAADYITLKNTEDGVAEAINHIILSTDHNKGGVNQ